MAPPAIAPPLRPRTCLALPDDAAVQVVLGLTSHWPTLHALYHTDRTFRRAVAHALALTRWRHLEPKQRAAALLCAFGRHHACIVGAAGTGKSFAVRAALAAFPGKVLAVAPTRRTARALDGKTIAAAVGIRPVELPPGAAPLGVTTLYHQPRHAHRPLPRGADVRSLATNLADDDADVDDDPDLLRGKTFVPVYDDFRATDLRACDTLIVDEAFMLTSFKFEQLLFLVRLYRGGTLPRLVLVGDPWQTDPFYSHTDRARFRLTDATGQYIFESKAFAERLFPDAAAFARRTVQLALVQRSADPEYHALLHNLRNDRPLAAEDVARWHARCRRDERPLLGVVGRHQHPSQPCRASVDAAAKEALAPWVAVEARDHGANPPRRLPGRVKVAVGMPCAVRFPEERERRRGLITSMTAIDADEGVQLAMTTLEGEEQVVLPRIVDRPVEGGEDWRAQYDLRLEAGMTVHATQGLTLRVPHAVYVETFWQRTMVYTALSRSSAMELLTVVGDMARIAHKVPAALKAFQQRLDALG